MTQTEAATWTTFSSAVRSAQARGINPNHSFEVWDAREAHLRARSDAAHAAFLLRCPRVIGGAP